MGRPGHLLSVLALAGLTACGAHPVAGKASPAASSTVTSAASPPPTVVQPSAPPQQTSYVPSPATDTPASSQWYAQPSWIASQPWIDITLASGQTACQWLYTHGYTYAQAFAAWAQNGYPASWSATGDGYPCQRSYGMQH